MLGRLLGEELLARAALVLGDALGLHRETGREHLGEHDQPCAVGSGLRDHRAHVLAGCLGVLPDDVVLDERDLHDSSFNLVQRFLQHLGRLQKAKRTK